MLGQGRSEAVEFGENFIYWSEVVLDRIQVGKCEKVHTKLVKVLGTVIYIDSC